MWGTSDANHVNGGISGASDTDDLSSNIKADGGMSLTAKVLDMLIMLMGICLEQVTCMRG